MSEEAPSPVKSSRTQSKSDSSSNVKPKTEEGAVTGQQLKAGEQLLPVSRIDSKVLERLPYIDMADPYSQLQRPSLAGFEPYHKFEFGSQSDLGKSGRSSFGSDRPNTPCSSLSSCELSPRNGSPESTYHMPMMGNGAERQVNWNFIEHQFSETLTQATVTIPFNKEYAHRFVQFFAAGFIVSVESLTCEFKSGFTRMFNESNITTLSCTVSLPERIDFKRSSYSTNEDSLIINLVKEVPMKWNSLQTVYDKDNFCREFIQNIPQHLGDDSIDDDVPLSPSLLARLEKDRQVVQQNLAKVNPADFPEDQENRVYERRLALNEHIGPIIGLNGPLQRERRLRVGYTGLDNLGNTCFMNAILQCLSNTDELREYFRTNAYETDVNAENPFGCGGKLAGSFSDLIKQLWNGASFSLSPKHFRNSIGDKFNLFSDFNQHDALEYMEHFMDMLHEEINRVDRRVRTIDPPLPKDEDELTDEEFANEMWSRHKRRNDSLVTDLFHGQLKSKLDCPVCPKVSLTFDPFLYLPVPLPKDIVEYSVFYFDKKLSRKPSKITMRLPLESKVNVLFESIKAKTGSSQADLQAYILKDSSVHKELTSGQLLPPPSLPDQLLAVFEVDSDPNDPAIKVLVHQRLSQPQRHETCAACSNRPTNPIVCSKCLRTVFCSSNCQARVSEDRHSNCSLKLDLVGYPFLVSIPKSQFTYHTLTERIMSCSRYSVDVTEPLSDRFSRGNIPLADTPDSDSSPEKSSECVEMGSGNTSPQVDEMGERSESMEAEPMEIGSLPRTQAVIDLASFTGDSIAQAVTKSFENSRIKTKKYKLGLKPDLLTKPLDDDQLLTEENCTDSSELIRRLQDNPEIVLDWQNGFLLNRDLLVESKELDHSCHYYDTKRARDDLEHTLEDCLRLFTEPETLSLEDSWHCPRCKKPREACKQLTIWRLPKIIVFQLKRFAYKNSTREKIKKFIRFPIKGLDLSAFCSPNSPQASQPEECLYDLFAVVNHFGGIYSGHYTNAARSYFNGEDLGWRLFDDCQVEDMEEDSIVTKDAYILFYRLRSLDLELKLPKPTDVQSKD